MKVKINFLALDLPPEEKPFIEYMTIKNKGEPRVNYYYGSLLPPKFISSGNEVEVAFKAGQNKGQNRGFLLSYLTYQESKNFISSNKSALAGTLTETGVYVWYVGVVHTTMKFSIRDLYLLDVNQYVIF